MRVLSVDPAVRNTGFAVTEGNRDRQTALDYGVIRIPSTQSQSQALSSVCGHLTNLIEKWSPDEMAVESIIYVQSHRTAISMGAARAAALIAAGRRGLKVYEYAPRKIKQAVVGKGTAGKEQVAYMVRVLLGLRETPPHDAADALAIGLAHFFALDPLRGASLERSEI